MKTTGMKAAVVATVVVATTAVAVVAKTLVGPEGAALVVGTFALALALIYRRLTPLPQRETPTTTDGEGSW